MTWAEWLLLLLLLWTLLGIISTAVAVARRDLRRARRGILSIVAVWAVYTVVLATVSCLQPRRVLAERQPQCFDEMCFAVTGAEEMQGFHARGVDPARLVRVSVSISNRARGKAQSESLIRAYLLDAQGRRWNEVPGLEGVRLTTRVAAGDVVVSQPVFRIAPDSSGLGLVLTHGAWQPGVLVIGDPDSWLHRPTVLSLPR